MYKNIESLRSKTDIVKLSEYHLKEYKKCKEDVFYFIKKYAIVNNYDKEVPIDLYKYKKAYISNILNYNKNLVLWARQFGLTTINTYIYMWYVLFHENYKVCIYSINTNNRNRRYEVFKSYLQTIPLWMQKPIIQCNKKHIEFSKYSSVDFLNNNPKSFNPKLYNLIIFDDFCFYNDKKANELYNRITKYYEEDNKFKTVFSTTGIAYDSMFYKIWKSNKYKKSIANWKSTPETNNKKWKEDKMKYMDINEFDNEYEFSKIKEIK